jgi:hypothetical protein
MKTSPLKLAVWSAFAIVGLAGWLLLAALFFAGHRGEESPLRQSIEVRR